MDERRVFCFRQIDPSFPSPDFPVYDWVELIGLRGWTIVTVKMHDDISDSIFDWLKANGSGRYLVIRQDVMTGRIGFECPEDAFACKIRWG